MLPANQTLTYAELKLLEEKERENALKRKLKDCLGFYDFVIIDCPPSLNILTVNALSFSNKVIIPAQCEYYALEGIASLVDTIEKITNSLSSEDFIFLNDRYSNEENKKPIIERSEMGLIEMNPINHLHEQSLA